eukprot:6513713-Alexandrium_andersonii.AAC.1
MLELSFIRASKKAGVQVGSMSIGHGVFATKRVNIKEAWQREVTTLHEAPGEVQLCTSRASGLLKQASRLTLVADRIRASKCADPGQWPVCVRSAWSAAERHESESCCLSE